MGNTVIKASALAHSSPAVGIKLNENLAPLTVSGYIPAGCTISIDGPVGQTSLLLELLASATSRAHWSAVVGISNLGIVAASQRGVDLSRVALIPAPGSQWSHVVSVLLDSMKLVIACPPQRIERRQADRLSALARRHNSILVVCPASGPEKRDTTQLWPIPTDAVFDVREMCWTGMEPGHGSLRSSTLSLSARNRRDPHIRHATMHLHRNNLTGTPAG